MSKADEGTCPPTFEREMGCTEAEWLRWLPGAVRGAPLQVETGRAQVTLGPGRLALQWQVLTPRVMALVRIPRLHVSFCFEGVAPAERDAFMRYFDLHTRRGGG
ncbi:hypothetical protein M8A51_08435 [Schlegelella sp. S2-27]|uniref:Uncharacterized protein n=1 Tax=Caldimonas mangrovi TaxID=2944811 RepID=A0ABT0YLM5_9BURK|nr:hypothetical protein [Caldimonas mangrovi]MCM5679558.1 hypothetical protein [Caldimonas mangrovi]